MKTYKSDNDWFGTTYKPINGEEVYEVPIANLSLHKMTKSHPNMTGIQFTQLVKSISEIGQQEPVKVYRKKIVDGRHRFFALKELGIPMIKVKVIPHKSSLEDVERLVFDSDTRRHKTITQLAISAWWDMQNNGLTYREASEKHAVSKTQIGHAKFIFEKRGNNMLKNLYNSKLIAVGRRTTGVISQARKLIQDEEANLLKIKLIDETSISAKEALVKAEKYTIGLSSENSLVIESVAKQAYKLLASRE